MSSKLEQPNYFTAVRSPDFDFRNYQNLLSARSNILEEYDLLMKSAGIFQFFIGNWEI